MESSTASKSGRAGTRVPKRDGSGNQSRGARREGRAQGEAPRGWQFRRSGGIAGEPGLGQRFVGGGGRNHPRHQGEQRLARSGLRGRNLVKPGFNRGAAVGAAIGIMVRGGLGSIQMVAAGKEIKARQHLETAMQTGRHPKDGNRNGKDWAPDSHLHQLSRKFATCSIFCFSLLSSEAGLVLSPRRL